LAGNLLFGVADADNDNIVDLDGTSSILIYGAQFEAGSIPTSYIPTAGATAIRAEETLTVASGNLVFNPLSVSFQMEGEMNYADTGISTEVQPLNWYQISTNNIIWTLSTITTRTGEVTFRQIAAGVDDFAQSGQTVYSPGLNVPFNIASRHGSTFINGAVEGTALTADITPVALPALSSTDLQIGTAFNGTIAKFRMWDEDLGDAGIEEAST
jgi:hypothetical protein